LNPGDTFAHYKVTEKIGAGGMGGVFRATDTKLGRDVALKVLPAGLAADPERLNRFRNEARTLASLQHPNVASIYGLEEVDSDGTPRSEPRPVLSNVSASTGDETAGDGSAVFSLSPAGDIIFRRGKDLTQQGYMATVDMNGAVTRIEAPVSAYFYPRVSPDGRTTAVSTVRNGRNELWLYDLVDGSSSRLVSTEGVTTLGFWSPDGEFLYFAQGGWSARGLDRVFVAAGGVPEKVLRDTSDLYPHDFSRDGRWLIINSHSEVTSWDIMLYDFQTHPDIPLDPVNLKPLVTSPAQDGGPRISPDGR
jgi:hypothetical protein